MSSRAGHHGDVTYKFEDAGFRNSPTDDQYKIFGGNVTFDTWEGSHQAIRVFNAEEYAAEIIGQTFDGAWGVSFQLTEPPWWLAGVLGQPGSGTQVGTTSAYEFTYSNTDANNPTTFRLYLPTDGFTNYEMLEGCTISTVTVDQTFDGSPDVSLSGAYAGEPNSQSTPSVSINAFTESTFQNRDAELQVGGSTVAKSQNTSITFEANVELKGEIGSETAVDFVPKVFDPNATFDKIIYASPTVDFLDRFRGSTQANIEMIYDNGQTGDNQYIAEFQVNDQFPDQFSESGRNDPEADLIRELQGMGETAQGRIVTDADDPDTAGEVPGLG